MHCCRALTDLFVSAGRREITAAVYAIHRSPLYGYTFQELQRQWPMSLIFHGVHGTCITHAKSILENGVKERLGSNGRAGTGFYLWPFISDHGRKNAQQLARDWYEDSLRKGRYDDCPEKGFAALTFDVSVETTEYINLNQARHHEKLNEIKARTPGEEQSKIYDEYLVSQSLFLEERYKTPLKMFEAIVPFPEATKARGPHLTTGADAYIVVKDGFGSLKLESYWPTTLRR